MATDPAQPAQHPSDGYAETPELEERIDRIGWLLAAGATLTFFFSFVFAFFYLRSLNNNALWKPSGVDAPDGWGVAIVACFIVSAIVFWLGASAGRRGRAWLPAAGIALLLGLAGCGLQAAEYTDLGFNPEGGGYASVFYGWTALYVIVALLALYRLETVFAAGVRNRRNREYPAPVGLLAGAYYWAMFAGIGLLAWILLYLV